MDTHLWMWVIFAALIPSLLALDLLVLQRRAHALSFREASLMVSFWVGLGLAFGGLLFVFLGTDRGSEYITAYVVEYSLSLDNIFVFIVIFTYFAVPQEAHHRVLYLGILGAIVFRGLFIFVGIEVLQRVLWAFVPLGAILLFTAIRLLAKGSEETHPDRIWLVRLARRYLKFSDTYHGAAFFVRSGGALVATPLFLVLLAIEGIDIVFAVDSVPAVLGITQDRLVAYSSNLFAILGLRSLYFLLSTLLLQLVYLRYGLAVVLGFIAVKLIIKPFHLEIPTLAALGVVLGTLALSIVASLVRNRMVSQPRQASSTGNLDSGSPPGH